MADYLSQSTLQLLIIGLVSIAAVSMGAATITSPLEVAGTGSDPGAGVEELPDEGGDPATGGEGNGTVSDEGETTYYDVELERCNEHLASIPGTILYFGAVVGVLGLIKRRYSTGAALIGLYGLSPIVLTVYFLGTACPEADDVGVGAGALTDGSGVGDELLVGPDVSPIWLIGLLVGLLVAAAAVVVRASGDQTVDVDEDAEPDAGAETDVRDLAAAAGDAADRLEEHDADVDNAVYRAWWEMTRLLDVPNPDSATPGEFAEAAIDIGVDEDDVSELTELFEEVRYGERDPESREDHAVDVFRSIEDEYGAETDVDLEAGSFGETATESDDGSADPDAESDSSTSADDATDTTEDDRR